MTAFLSGLWHSVVVYFGCMLLWKGDPAFLVSGITLDYWSFGTLIYHAVIFIVSLKVSSFLFTFFSFFPPKFHNSLSNVAYDRISFLDGAVRFLRLYIDYRFYRTHVSVLWSRLVRLLIERSQIIGKK